MSAITQWVDSGLRRLRAAVRKAPAAPAPSAASARTPAPPAPSLPAQSGAATAAPQSPAASAPPAPSDPFDTPDTLDTPAQPAIRALGPGCRAQIAQHLLALDCADRYLRFGYAAGDEQIRRYVGQIDFGSDRIYGVYDRRQQLIAVAHLAQLVEPPGQCAEFGVSVCKSARGRGLGTQLFAHAARHARNAGVQVLFVHALSQNSAMLKIARRAGASVRCDGAQSQAWLQLPPAADPALRTARAAGGQAAQAQGRCRGAEPVGRGQRAPGAARGSACAR